MEHMNDKVRSGKMQTEVFSQPSSIYSAMPYYCPLAQSMQIQDRYAYTPLMRTETPPTVGQPQSIESDQGFGMQPEAWGADLGESPIYVAPFLIGGTKRPLTDVFDEDIDRLEDTGNTAPSEEFNFEYSTPLDVDENNMELYRYTAPGRPGPVQGGGPGAGYGTPGIPFAGVDVILARIERNNPGIFRTLESYRIPPYQARNIVRRIIRLTLQYGRL